MVTWILEFIDTPYVVSAAIFLAWVLLIRYRGAAPFFEKLALWTKKAMKL